GGGVVGHRGVVHLTGGGPEAVPRDEHRLPVRADRHRAGLVIAVVWAVVTAGPQLGAGGGVVADRGVVLERSSPDAGPGDEHRLPVRADRHRTGVIGTVAAVVPLDPQAGTGTGR